MGVPDGEPVVSAEEDDGGLERGRHVEGPVEVPLARRPLAEVAHGHAGSTLQL